jgi:hypothetical protein
MEFRGDKPALAPIFSYRLEKIKIGHDKALISNNEGYIFFYINLFSYLSVHIN